MFKRFAVDIENINVGEDFLLEERALPLVTPIVEEHAMHADTPDSCPPPLVENIDSSIFLVEEQSLQQLVDAAYQRASLLRMGPGPQGPAVLSRQKIRDVRVFCNFLAAAGKKCSFNVRMKEQVARGIDVVEATIRAFMSSDERLRQKYSENPRLYKLFVTDDHTGEEIGLVQLDSSCQNFTCLSVTPLPEAQLFLFPTRSGLLPQTAHNVPLTIEIRSPESKIVRRILSFPADLLVEKLEAILQVKLPVNSITFGTLRVRYGPAELYVTQKYDFGLGCGTVQLPISERTICSIQRFGVTELIVDGQVPDQEPSSGGQETSLDNVKRLDEEEARAYQQFDVIKINKFGIRQQRVIGVDAERVYNMRPSSEVGKTKNPERQIEDIETIRDFRDRPTFCEIEYSKASKYDTDKIECRNAFDCAMLVEKLRMLKKIHGRKELKKNETPLSRFFGKFPFGK